MARDTSPSVTVGDLLRRYRRAAGWTQEELAERAHVSPHAIGDLERGVRNRPWRETLQLLADALQLEPAERARRQAIDGLTLDLYYRSATTELAAPTGEHPA